MFAAYNGKWTVENILHLHQPGGKALRKDVKMDKIVEEVDRKMHVHRRKSCYT